MKVMYTFISLSVGEKKCIDLARAKSKALVNIYSLLKQNMKSCKLSGDGNETVGVMTNNNFTRATHFFVHFFALVLHD